MMKITKEMMTNTLGDRVNVPAEILQHRTERLKHCFVSNFKWNMTPLADSVIPIIAARHCDFLDDREEGAWDDALLGASMLGNVGTGKSILLNFAAYCFNVGVVSVPDLARAYATDGDDGFWDMVENNRLVGNDLMLDDLGAEEDTRRFGNRLPIVDLIYRRYNDWTRRKSRIWISSNLTAGQMAERYDERVVDRIKEMTTVIPATGKSMR